MKVTLQSTTYIVYLDGLPARIWEGTTESGIRVHALITRIAIDEWQNRTEFEKELQEHAPPSLEIANFYLISTRLVI